MDRYASIDAGTNSTRMLLVEVIRKGGDLKFNTLKRVMKITRMGENVDDSGRLGPQGLERTRQAMEDYHSIIESYGGAERICVVGTSATRDAVNAYDFRNMVEEVFGVEPRILSGEEEARLSYLGATWDLGELVSVQGQILVVDIGGGSTEMVLGDGKEIIYHRSVDVGCVRMSERYLASDPPRESELQAMEREIARALEPVTADLKNKPVELLIGLAGTITTLSAMSMGLAEYRGELIHGSWLTREGVEEMYRKMVGMGLRERKAYMGLEPERADVILGGAAVLLVLLRKMDAERLLVSEKDILDGLVIEEATRSRS